MNKAKNILDQCKGCSNRDMKNSNDVQVFCSDMPKVIFMAWAEKKYVKCPNRKDTVD